MTFNLGGIKSANEHLQVGEQREQKPQLDIVRGNFSSC